ncbi:MAG: hypothetical protein ACUVX8_01205 [Candidatus Zipacnadales bacterium]
MTSPIPSSTPPTTSSKMPIGLLIGCLVGGFVLIVLGAAVGLILWHPWTRLKLPLVDRTHKTTLSEKLSTLTNPTDQTTEATTDTTNQTKAFAFLNITAGNAAANGASFKLFNEAGMPLHNGTIPASLPVPPDSRCKLVVSKPGYELWEGWQSIGGPTSTHDVSVRLEKLPPNQVVVTICTATGKQANPWCPTTVRRQFDKGREPGPCTLHRPPTNQVEVSICTATGRRANRYCPSRVNRIFDANRVPPVCTVHGPPPSPPQTVTKTVCTITGKLANQYCPSVTQKTFPVNAVPGVCTTHKAPPPPPPPPQNRVEVRICDGSGQKAGPYCPSTHVETIPKNAIPPRCQLHATPPPKPPADAEQYKWCPQCNARNRINARLCRKCGYRF